VSVILLSDFYRSLFGCKAYKVSLDAGCTCPNRDGSKGYGGCVFCSNRGSGDFIENVSSIQKQFDSGVELVSKKAAGRSGQSQVKYIPYFQAFTSTYGDSSLLKRLYIEAIAQKNVCGIAIATRPDCISDEIIEIFKELAEKTFLQIELGLQTSCENTGRFINRCYTNNDYEEAVRRFKKEIPAAHIVTHLIFGLPEENEADMMDSLDFVINTNKALHNPSLPVEFWGIKITNLYVLKNTVLGRMYEEKKYIPLEEDEYFCLLEKALLKLPENCVIHRINGDPPKKESLAPLDWTLDSSRR